MVSYPERFLDYLLIREYLLGLLERSSLAPGTPIKAERDSLTDIYDASPRSHVYQAASHGQRQQSRSTAQLSTPISSPEGKCPKCCPDEGHRMVRLEFEHESYGRQNVVDGSCTPPASVTERDKSTIKFASRRVPTTPQRSSPTALHELASNQDIQESSVRAKTQSTTSTLLEKPMGDVLSRTKTRALSTLGTCMVSSRSNQPQKGQQPLTKLPVSGRMQCNEPPPILPPLKVRPATSRILTATAVPTNRAATLFLTPKRTLHVSENITKKTTCCKLMCSQCTPKDIWEEYGLGHPEKRPNVPRLKSLSACPSSVLSFGSNDEVPSLDEMYRTAGRALNNSTKTFVLERLSEISPSLKYSDKSLQFGDRIPDAADKGDSGNIYDDITDGNFPQKDPRRMLFRKARKCVTDQCGRDLIDTSQRLQTIGEDVKKGEKKLSQIPSRKLRSFSAANDLSKKVQIIKNNVNQNGENESLVGEDEDSSSEFEDGQSRKSLTRASQGIKRSSRSIERAREAMDDWQPTNSDNEEDLMEINREVFTESESRRKKRHKCQSEDDERNSAPKNPIPEETGTEGEGITSFAKDRGTAEIAGEDIGTSRSVILETLQHLETTSPLKENIPVDFPPTNIR